MNHTQRPSAAEIVFQNSWHRGGSAAHPVMGGARWSKNRVTTPTGIPFRGWGTSGAGKGLALSGAICRFEDDLDWDRSEGGARTGNLGRKLPVH